MKTPRLLIPCLALLFPSPGFSADREITVMSFNTWHDWNKVENGFDKAEAAIRKSGADLVGLQESTPATAARMAAKLGWHHAEGGNGSVQIISRHEITGTITSDKIENSRFIGARIRVTEAPAREIVLFNIHLDYQHYGPYAARIDGATPASVLQENSLSKRPQQMTDILAAMKPAMEKSDAIPVILTGDFNVPSHLDWTAENSVNHQRIGAVSWPETSLLGKSGFVDSYRFLHPDPHIAPGTTWSSIHKNPEPQDRIDFIHHHGSGMKVVKSETFTTAVEVTIGAWGTDLSPVMKNTWPSDHAAVVTTYRFE